MSVAGMMTPVRSETFDNLQLDAGAFFTGLDMSTITTASALRTAALAAISDPTKCLGATRGGGEFKIDTEDREREIDGLRYRFVGSTARDSIDPHISTTLVEVFPGNIARVLGTADVDSTTATKQKITMHTRIQSADYIPNLTWVGDLLDGRLVAIVLKNALNTAGGQLTFSDKGEGTMPVEFHAHQANVDDYDNAPFEVYFMSDPASTPAG